MIFRQLFDAESSTYTYLLGCDETGQCLLLAQERERNPRLGGGKELTEFVSIMDHLNLPYPDKMDISVPANLRCGEATARASRHEGARGKAKQG